MAVNVIGCMDRFANNYDPSVTTPCSDCCDYGKSESIDLGFTNKSSLRNQSNFRDLPGLPPGGGIGIGIGIGDGPIGCLDKNISSTDCFDVQDPCLRNPSSCSGGGGDNCANRYIPGIQDCPENYRPGAPPSVSSCCVKESTGGGTGGGGGGGSPCGPDEYYSPGGGGGAPGPCNSINNVDYERIGPCCRPIAEDEEPDNTNPVNFYQMSLCIGDTGYETLRSENQYIPDGWWGTNSSTTNGDIDIFKSGAGFDKYFDDLISKNGGLDNLLSTSLNITNSDKLKTYFREIQLQKPNKRVFVNPNNLLPFIYRYTTGIENNFTDTTFNITTYNTICSRLGGEGNVITYTPPQNQGFTLPNETFFTCLCDAPEPEIPTSCEELGCPEGFQCLNGECSPIPDPTQGCRARPYDGWIKARDSWDYFYNRS